MPKIILVVLFIYLLPFSTHASQDKNTYFCERDCTMEYNLFKKYAQKGSSLANLSMAIMNYQGHGRSKNINLANKQLISAARAGEPAAMYQLGYNLMFGLYIKQDLEKSLVWFKRASRHGALSSNKFITIIKRFFNIENKQIQSTLKSMLSENMNTEKRAVTIQEKSQSVEHISVTYQFTWSLVLYNAKLQTCHSNCITGLSHTMVPIIHVANENVLLDDLQKLTNNN